MFVNSTQITDLSNITINCSSTRGSSVASLIKGCENCIKPPHITGTINTDFNGLANECYYLQELFDFSNTSIINSSGTFSLTSIYSNCIRLNKSIDFSFLSYEDAGTSSIYQYPYSSLAY